MTAELSPAAAQLLERVAHLRRPRLDVSEVLAQAERAPLLSHQAFAAMRVGEEGWLVPLEDLAATAMAGQWATWSQSPPGVRGIVNVRGQVYTVLDMQELLHQQPAPEHQEGWLTALTAQRAEGLALWWPQWVGLKDRSAFTPLDRTHPQARQVWADEGGQVWHEWDLQAWLARQPWIQTPSSVEE